MKVVAIIPKTEKEVQKYIVEATEKEIDLVSGISDVEHISGRIKVGHEVNVSEVYNNINEFSRNKENLRKAQKILRQTADSIENIIPKAD